MCCFFIAVFFFFHVCLLWILIAHLLQALLQMLAGLAWIEFQSQIPLASVPVTLLHGDGTRAGAEAETGAGADAGLPGDRRQQAQEINTSTGASLRSNMRRCCDDVMRQGGFRVLALPLEMPYLQLTVRNHFFLFVFLKKGTHLKDECHVIINQPFLSLIRLHSN